MVNSGSSANLISVASLFFKKDNPLKRGDEVIGLDSLNPYYDVNLKLGRLKDLGLDLDLRAAEEEANHMGQMMILMMPSLLMVLIPKGLQKVYSIMISIKIVVEF